MPESVTVLKQIAAPKTLRKEITLWEKIDPSLLQGTLATSKLKE